MDYNKAIYKMQIDRLRLVASTYKVQCETLPDYVDIVFEIFHAVENIYTPQLLEAGIITEIQAKAFNDFDAYLDTFDEYIDNLRQQVDVVDLYKELESGPWFNELRKKALALLELLGEGYERPTLDGTTYVPGT